ncbi:hypothetical protein A3Q56_06427 [Intoshia linei]|uniref:Integrase catalytic domain-containing protein n=1 Tax=Intoshia linei TaxID=1819745 RepID=A0A177AWU3_9BILA|nr:hypothetical protein A3Q56_06427 [Intoshia linei]
MKPRERYMADCISLLEYEWENWGYKYILNSYDQMKVGIIHGRPQHPQSQGQVERANQTIKRWLAKTLQGGKCWIDILVGVVRNHIDIVDNHEGETTPYIEKMISDANANTKKLNIGDSKIKKGFR